MRWSGSERGKLTTREAAEVLGLSTRQVRRLRRAVERRGAAGVVHGNRGRAPSNRVDGGAAGANRGAAAQEVRRVQRPALHGEAVRGGGSEDLARQRAADAAGGGHRPPAQAAGAEAPPAARSQAAGGADDPVGREPPRVARGARADAVSDGGDRRCDRRAAPGRALRRAGMRGRVSARCSRRSPRRRGCRGAPTWISTAASNATTTTGRSKRSCAGRRTRRRWAGRSRPSRSR